ncbi:MAG: hypothetical protein RL186_811 [Pseudomonadota bacterium]
MLATTIISGLAFTAPAFAQTESTTEAKTEVIVVTGTRIAQKNLVTTSPVTQIGGAELTSTGVSRVEDLVNQLPQAFAAQNSTVSNGSSGTATVDLRGLGASRTLVLVDGRRMGYGSPNLIASDLNQIPSALVERVEVLTGGASAVYGSDAISGVVNFIMKKEFTGVQLDVQHSFYSHKNDFSGKGDLRSVIAARAAANPSEFALPKDDVTDGRSTELSVIMGAGTDDGRGHFMAYATYNHANPVLQRDRDYSACSIGTAGTTAFTCGGSSTNAKGRFFSIENDANLTLASGNTFRNFSGATDQYNFGPINYFQRPEERYSLGSFGRYEINSHAEVYTQLMFTDSSTVAQIAPSGAFFGGGNAPNGGFFIPCNNPLLTGAQATALGCTAEKVAAGSAVEVLVGRRNVEGGGRQDDLNHRSFRGVLGLKGEITNGWTYDLSAQLSSVRLARVYRNEFSITRTARALDVVSHPTTGAPVCRSTLPDANGFVVDPNCVPYNLWKVGGITADQLAYIQIPGVQIGKTSQQVVSGSVSGDLGIKSPLATSNVQVVFGLEYRRDELSSEPDSAFSTGDLFGQGGPTIGVAGATEATDLFGEIQAALIEDKPLAKLVSLDAAYRHAELGSKSTDTYKVGLDWAPVDDIRFRGSVSRAVRAANVLELFTAQGLGLFDLDADPCGASKTATLAQCVATGVPAANYGSELLDSPAAQFNQLNGGSKDLSPETADTVTFGAVFTPTFFSGFNLSVDYFSIEVADLISTVDPLITVSQCYEKNDQAACARIKRNAIGTFWTSGGYVEAINTNIGGLKTSGIDVNANYRFDLDNLGLKNGGKIALSLNGTYLQKLETDPGVGDDAIYDCVGTYGNECGTPNPEWRHRARAVWSTPWDVELSAAWRYYGEVVLKTSLAADLKRVDYKFDAENYIDISASWDVRDNVSLVLGVNNVLDNDPQLSASAGTSGNGNTFPQTYDSMGRYVFMSASLKF